MPRGLRRVYHEQQSVTMAKLADLANGKGCRAKIGGVGAYHQLGFGLQTAGNSRADANGVLARIARHAWETVKAYRPLLCQSVQGTKDRVVLQIGDQDVIALTKQALEYDIQTLGRIHRKKYPFGIGYTEEFGGKAAALEYFFRRRHGKRMPSPSRITAVLRHAPYDLIGDGTGLGEGGCRVVQIDQSPSFHCLTDIRAASKTVRTLFFC